MTPSGKPRIGALVLAGGRGTRIAAFYPDLPKPMVPVAEVPFLDWFTRRLVKNGLDDILLSTGYLAETIARWVAERPTIAQEKIRCVAEPAPLGTGGALAHCLPFVTTPLVLILNGDTLLLTDLGAAALALQDTSLDGVIFARPIADASRYGSLEVQNGLLKSFREKQPGAGLINGGVYAFRTDWLRARLSREAASFETAILPRLLTEGARLGVIETDAPFIDIGTPETLAEAESFVLNHRDSF